jgi:hypothetical protein
MLHTMVKCSKKVATNGRGTTTENGARVQKIIGTCLPGQMTLEACVRSPADTVPVTDRNSNAIEARANRANVATNAVVHQVRGAVAGLVGGEWVAAALAAEGDGGESAMLVRARSYFENRRT